MHCEFIPEPDIETKETNEAAKYTTGVGTSTSESKRAVTIETSALLRANGSLQRMAIAVLSLSDLFWQCCPEYRG